jgi:hypothetical protein
MNEAGALTDQILVLGEIPVPTSLGATQPTCTGAVMKPSRHGERPGKPRF